MHQEHRIIRKIITDEVIVGLRDDRIVHVFYKEHTELDIKLQLEILEFYFQICGDEKYPFIFEADEYVTITKEARDNAIVLEEKSPVSMSAIIVKNLAHKLIADFYLKFNKPKMPFKVFKDFQEGIDWLKKMNTVE